jgi:hypothetical protein
MTNATCTFHLPGRYAGAPVTIYNVDTNTQVTTATADSNAKVVVSVPEGDYYLLTADKLYVRALAITHGTKLSRVQEDAMRWQAIRVTKATFPDWTADGKPAGADPDAGRWYGGPV